MKIRWKTLIIAIAIPLAVGALSAFLTMGSMEHFASLEQPPLSPPGWLFPVVWTVLFALMGIASYLVFESGAPAEKKSAALRVYALQLAFNFLWSILFFNLDMYWAAFVWLLALLVLIIITTVMFYRIRPAAAYLMIPYIAWVTFAAYLNVAIAILN